jgi:phosphonate transport system substrate-binding protein
MLLPNREAGITTMRAALAGFVVVLSFAAGVLPVTAQDKPAVLRVGMVSPTGAASGIQGLAAIRRAYTQATGLEVRVFAARDTAALVEAQASGRVHYAIYSAAGYAAAQAACACVEPLAAPSGSFGDTGLHAVVYARTGKAATLEAAAALRVVAGPADAVGPQVLALDALAAAGAGDDVMLAPSLEAAEAAFAAGGADVLVGWEPAVDDHSQEVGGTAARLAELGMSASDMTELWRSAELRYGPHAVRSDLPEEVKRSLRNFLLNVHARQPAVYDLVERRHLGGFVAVSDADYAAAAAMVALAAE